MKPMSAPEPMPSGAIRISVVIPFRDASAHLQACLNAVQRSEGPPHELILVDDGSNDESRVIARRSGAKVITLPESRGPAFARNRGAEQASGDVLFFIDADVLCRHDTLAKIAESFSRDPGLSAVIGSYDEDPPARNFLSRYKNLTHHFVHQHGSSEASTFWTGCGAVRRSIFREFGGFDETYRRPSIEDIELGYRMRAAGRRIGLRKDLLVAHAKVWGLGNLLRSDIRDRAIPWTALQLQHGSLLNDLNVTVSQRIASLMAWVFVAGAAGGFFNAALWLAAGVGGAGLVSINRDLYRFYLRKGGGFFALGCAGMHVLYYLYSTAAFSAGCVRHLRPGTAPAAGARARHSN